MGVERDLEREGIEAEEEGEIYLCRALFGV